MSSVAGSSRGRQTERLDYIAEHLPGRAAVLVRLLVKQVRSREISRTEMEVLSILREGPRRIAELTELEGISQPSMTLLVKRLEDKGWVGRDGVPNDGRVVMISLTELGTEAQQQFRAQFISTMRADLRELPDEQLEALASATETLDWFVGELQRQTGRRSSWLA